MVGAHVGFLTGGGPYPTTSFPSRLASPIIGRARRRRAPASPSSRAPTKRGVSSRLRLQTTRRPGSSLPLRSFQGALALRSERQPPRLGGGHWQLRRCRLRGGLLRGGFGREPLLLRGALGREVRGRLGLGGGRGLGLGGLLRGLGLGGGLLLGGFGREPLLLRGALGRELRLPQVSVVVPAVCNPRDTPC